MINRDKVTYNFCYEDIFQDEDLENRRLVINGDIDENSIDNIVYHIMRYNRMDKGIPAEDRKPIIVYINSLGGNLSEGFGVIDAIQNSKTPVYTVNLANCLSMGLMIFIAGHKRYAMPHSEFFLHDGDTGGFDSSSKMQDRIWFESGQIADMRKSYIIVNTKITEKQYDSNLRKEWYFLPREGKEIGVVDYIVGEDCDIDVII